MSDQPKSRLTTDIDFDKDGRQTGFIRLFHSVHSSAYGFIPIPLVVIRNGVGKTALFVSGNHGDEYEGQVALCNLAQSLDPAGIKGRVIILPMANFPAGMAGQRTSPIDGGNLNREFPGRWDGTVTQKIAHYISSELIPKADIVCDLHSGGSSLMYMPSALMKTHPDKKQEARTRAALEAFAAPIAYVSEGGQGTGADLTLGGVAERQGIVSLGTELGGSGTVTAAALAMAERGLRNLLAHVGILPASALVKPEKPTRIVYVGGADYFVYSSEPGVYQPLAEPGDTVKAGQRAALIHTPETPWRAPAELKFARDGVVLCKRVPGRTVRGDCLFHLGTE